MRIALLENYYNSEVYLDYVRRRAKELYKLDGDPIYQMQQIKEVYAESPIAFIEQFAVIKIPEFNSAIKPFHLFDYQREVLWKLFESENDTNRDHEILIDKVREMGLTWVLVWYIIWGWLFKQGWSAFIMSRTEDEVDDGTSNPDSSIFGKIRWALKKLPGFIKPVDFTHKVKKGTSTDMMLKIINPGMGTSINGSTTNRDAGRSRRYNFIFVDEAFYVENFGTVYASLQSVARTKVFVSTSRAGFVYKNLKEICERNHDYISLSWKQNPFKDQQWYDEQREKAVVDDSVMKEIEVSYTVSGKTRYYPEGDKSKVEPAEYNPMLPLYEFLDVGKNDLTVIGYAQYDGELIKILECYHNKLKPMEWYVPFINWSLFFAQEGSLEQVRELGASIMDPTVRFEYNDAQLEFIRLISRWKKPRACFGEVAHTQKSMPLNISVKDVLFKAGSTHLTINDNATGYETRRRATSLLLPKMVFNSQSQRVMQLYDAILNSRYANSGRATSARAAMAPVHDDEIADFRSALENFSVNFPRTLRIAQHDPNTRKSNEQVSQYRSLTKYLKN